LNLISQDRPLGVIENALSTVMDIAKKTAL